MSVFSIFSLITSLLSGNKNIPDTTKNIYNSLDLVLGANHFSYYKKRGGGGELYTIHKILLLGQAPLSKSKIVKT